MKTRILLVISFLLLNSPIISCLGAKKDKEINAKNSLTIDATAQTYEVASIWAEAFRKANPGMECAIQLATPEELSKITLPGLSIVSQQEVKTENVGWHMAIGREVIVPVLNENNPVMKDLLTRGVSREMLIDIMKNPGKITWGEITGTDMNAPVHVIIADDKLVTGSLEQYLGIEPSNNALTDGQMLLQNIRNDAYGLGFCKLTSVLDPGSEKLTSGLALLPIDKNGNGKLDYIENFYTDPNELLRAVWIGKYPRALSSDIMAVAGGQPEDATTVAFLKWVITDGQQYLAQKGLNELVYAEVQSKLGKLDEGVAVAMPEARAYSVPKLILFLLAAMLVLSIMIGSLAGYGKRRKEKSFVHPADLAPGFDNHTVNIPKGLLYGGSHTWAFMDTDGAVRLGVDDFLQHVTGNITRIILKKEGDKIKKGEPFVTLVQKGKQLTLYAPVTGTVKESNPALAEDPALLNTAPYADGWVYRVEPSNWLKEMPLLSMASKYSKWLNDEMIKLKDFLAFPSQPQQLQYLQILQDGGLLKNHVLEEMGPEVWEEFQTKFLDSNK